MTICSVSQKTTEFPKLFSEMTFHFVFAGIEARGFIFGPPIALAIGAKFVPLRKPRKLPGNLNSCVVIFLHLVAICHFKNLYSLRLYGCLIVVVFYTKLCYKRLSFKAYTKAQLCALRTVGIYELRLMPDLSLCQVKSSLKSILQNMERTDLRCMLEQLKLVNMLWWLMI